MDLTPIAIVNSLETFASTSFLIQKPPQGFAIPNLQSLRYHYVYF